MLRFVREGGMIGRGRTGSGGAHGSGELPLAPPSGTRPAGDSRLRVVALPPARRLFFRWPMQSPRRVAAPGAASRFRESPPVWAESPVCKAQLPFGKGPSRPSRGPSRPVKSAEWDHTSARLGRHAARLGRHAARLGRLGRRVDPRCGESRDGDSAPGRRQKASAEGERRKASTVLL